MDVTSMSTGSLSALVTLVGLVVVFSVLILLTLVIWIYSALVRKAMGKPVEKKQAVEKAKSAPAPVPAPPRTTEPVMTTATLTVEDNIPGDVVAAIAAAVDYMYDGRPAPVIRQIKRAKSARSPWAAAGLVDNTRPF